MTLDGLLAFAHTVAWAVYIGGALAMELLWRPAQAAIPPSLVNVVCQRMGERYRWIALSALAVIGVTGLAQLVDAGLLNGSFPQPLSPSGRYGRTLLLFGVGWLSLVVIVVMMAVAAHPALHVRTSGAATPEERAASRTAVARAIRRMDFLLRLDLAVGFTSALLAASLPSGGLL